MPEYPLRSLARPRVPVIVMCFFAVFWEGYDLVCYGAALPAMLSDKSWGLDVARLGFIGSLTLVGMLIGSLIAGTLADYTGRRFLTIVSCTWFAAWMLVCAASTDGSFFAFARFMVGLGIGVFVPLAAALAVEFAPPGRGNTYSAISWAGYPVGGIAASLLAFFALDPLGPRFLFLLGGLPLITLVPVLVLMLPESPNMLANKGRVDEARAIADQHGMARPNPVAAGEARGPAALFTRQQWLGSVLFGLLAGCGLLLTYGLTTWLPQIMRTGGYELGSALTFLLLFNLGALVVPLIASRVADSIGPRLVISGVLTIAAACVLLLVVHASVAVVGVLVFAIGGGTLGAQILVAGFSANYYPASSRVAGLSWVSCAGRVGAIGGPTLIGNLLSGGGIGSSVLLFAAVALLGAVITIFIRKPRPAPVRTTARAAVAAAL
jgi:AAHS family benzoate transporter-like MFS transporter